MSTTDGVDDLASSAPASVHRSNCRLCGAKCGVMVTVVGDTIVSVRGDAENPVSEGYICPKGRLLGAAHHDPRRLRHASMGRAADRLEVDSAVMLDDLATRLRVIIDESGPDAVGFYIGLQGFHESGSYGPIVRLMNAIGSRTHFSIVTLDNVAKMVAGLKITGGVHTLYPKVDYDGARFLLILGNNPVISHAPGVSNPVVRLRRIMSRGEVWVVDPRRTETARLATRHLQLRASTDAFLLAHLVRELLRNGADYDYLSDHAIGVEALREVVEPHTREVTAARTGLTEDDLRDLVEAIRHAGTIAVSSGVGTRMGPNPTTTEWLTYAVSIITGSMDRAGGNFNKGRGVEFGPAWATAVAPGPRSRPELTKWAGQSSCASMAAEIAAGNLRALISVGGNPASSIMDTRGLGEALANIEVFAVHDIFPTRSTDLATHVLPAASAFEDGSMIGSATHDGRAYMQYSSAFLTPTDDCRPMWWYVAELAKRLGLTIFNEPLTEADAHGPHAGSSKVDLVRSSPGGMLVGEKIVFETLVDDLPGGRWDLAPDGLVEELAQLNDITADLVLIPRRQTRHLNWFLTDVAGPTGKLDEPDLLIHPDDARRLGLTDRDVVIVESPTGSLTTSVSVTDDIARGSVCMPHGHRDAEVNLLTSARRGLDSISGMPRFSGIPVTVRRADTAG